MNPQANDLRSVLAGLVAADRDYDAARGAWNALAPSGIGEIDSRTQDDYEPLSNAKARRATAIARADELEAALLHGGGGEAVAWGLRVPGNDHIWHAEVDERCANEVARREGDEIIPLYTTPPPASQSAPSAGDVPFDTVRKVVRAISRLGHTFPEGQEEQAARAIELIETLCHEVHEHFDRITNTTPSAGSGELPEPAIVGWHDDVARCVFLAAYRDDPEMTRYYTADQMRAYGEQCRRLATAGQGVE